MEIYRKISECQRMIKNVYLRYIVSRQAGAWSRMSFHFVTRAASYCILQNPSVSNNGFSLNILPSSWRNSVSLDWIVALPRVVRLMGSGSPSLPGLQTGASLATFFFSRFCTAATRFITLLALSFLLGPATGLHFAWATFRLPRAMVGSTGQVSNSGTRAKASALSSDNVTFM